jgi:SAM-dependent methyltransferase
MSLQSKPTVYRRPKARILPQDHLIAGELRNWFLRVRHANPDAVMHWLDVCCGTGDYLKVFPELLPDESLRKRIYYTGYDLHNIFLRECRKNMACIDLAGRTKCGELPDLRAILDNDRFNAITLVNALHELPSTIIPQLLLDIVEVLRGDGFLFVFDVATLPHEEPESGSTPWLPEDINTVMGALLQMLGAKTKIFASEHRSPIQPAWYFIVHREDLPVLDDPSWQTVRPAILGQLANVIASTFSVRKQKIHRSIEELSEQLYDAEGWASEDGEKGPNNEIQALRNVIDVKFRDFWAFGAELAALQQTL